MSRAFWLVLGMASVTLTLLNYIEGGDEWALSFVVFGIVGTFVAWKVPNHASGPLMIGLSATSALTDSEALGQIAAATDGFGALMPFLMGLFLVTFPGGGVSHPWWRHVIAIAALLSATNSVLLIRTGEENPFLLVPVVGFAMAATIDLVVRYRRAAGDEKAQTKLVVFATVLTAVVLVASGLPGVPDPMVDVLVVTGFSLIPLAVGAAIVRHRLYEIDRLISRTISYIVVVGLLAAAYASLVWVITSLIGAQSSLAVAASTLAVVTMFNPIQRRVLLVVDRRFNRTRYESEKVLETFTAAMQDVADAHLLKSETIAVVRQALQPASMGFWLKEPGDQS